MITTLFWVSVAVATIITALAIGETIARRFPTGKFSKWWRNHVLQHRNDIDI